MKLLSNKVNIIPVIARGDSLTKKELDTFKRRVSVEWCRKSLPARLIARLIVV
jgi:septin family protein